MEDKRSFTVVSGAQAGGRFISSTPRGAAAKAARRTGAKTVKIQETTRGSSGKVFEYKVTKVRDPITVNKGGQEITFTHKTVVKAIRR